MIAPAQRGMTLLELLVAMAVFSLVAAAGYAGLDQGISVQERLQDKRIFWRQLETAFLIMEQDLNQTLNRPSRTTVLQRPAFRGFKDADTGSEGRLLELSRGGHDSFRNGPVSPYLHVTYELRERSLIRTTWPRLDRPQGREGIEADLISGITDIQLRYLRGADNWTGEWPQTSNTEEPAGLPGAVRLTLELEDHGTFERVFHVGPPD